MNAVPPMLERIFECLPVSGADGRASYVDRRMRFTGTDRLPSCFDTTGLAAYTIAAAANALASYCRQQDVDPGPLIIDQRLASLWFGQSLVPEGWQVPPMWDDLAGDYRARDGWIRLHTNAPHHRLAALSVLDCRPQRDAVGQAVAVVAATDLEEAIVDAGGCAAEMRSLTEWRQHPQGRAVIESPLITWQTHGEAAPGSIAPRRSQPLQGIRVLDLTRVIAGPAATRFLAAYGADVLRIDPVGLWDDSDNAPEMTLGKRCAGLDLRRQSDRHIFASLIEQADLLVHGYRPAALEGLGFGDDACRKINSALITISLCAYGWSGPWADRRGFDSLVQMSSGIAAAGMEWGSSQQPVPLPVQALDHATGYLIAAAAIDALTLRVGRGQIRSARLSLAKTADLLSFCAGAASDDVFSPVSDRDVGLHRENTPWGNASRIRFPVHFEQCNADWRYPAGHLRSSKPDWSIFAVDSAAL